MHASQNTLMPYQHEGVRFLTEKPHRLLADDMGLGKTVQVAHAAFNALGVQSALIICPSQVKYHWAREIAKWSETHKAIFIIQNGKTILPPFKDVIIVNYELLLRHAIYRQLMARAAAGGFDLVVCDEAHYLKTPNAQRTNKVLGTGSFLRHIPRKWTLTGFPVPNRISEFWPILHTLAPEVIAPHLSWDAFGRYFCTHNGHAPDGLYRDHNHVEELSARLESFMLRRTKEQVLDQLPDKVETVVEFEVEIPLYPEEAPLATVRKAMAIAKIPESVVYIKNMMEVTEKLVIFAHHRDVLSQLKQELVDFKPVLWWGGMTAEQKEDALERFQNEPGTRIFLGQTHAAGTGVDGLQGVCNTVAFIELDWSPGVMSQAVDRLRRIGQRNTVFVYYFAVSGSIDTTISNVLEHKRYVIKKLLNDEKETSMSANSTVAMVQEILTAINGIGAAMNAMTNILNAHVSPGATAPAAAAKGKAKASATVAPEADPPTATAPAAVPTTVAQPSQEDLYKAVAAFIASAADQGQAKQVISGTLLPKFGAQKLIDLDTSNYAGLLAELAKGAEAFTAGDPLAGI